MQRFVADQRHRERDGLPSLGMKRPDGSPSPSPTNTRSVVFNARPQAAARRAGHRRGRSHRPGREFIVAMPDRQAATGRTRADRSRTRWPARWPTRTTCARLAETTTRCDRGLRDIWETTVAHRPPRQRGPQPPAGTASAATAGCRCSGTTRPRSATTTRRIRIPEHALRTARRTAAQDHWTASPPGTAGRPTDAERARHGAVPQHHVRNPDGTSRCPTSGSTAGSRPGSTSSTSAAACRTRPGTPWPPTCCAPGASLTHIRRYLGQVSERMAEHYVHLSHSDLEDVLQHVWVAGPGAANPGELLTGRAHRR